MGGFFIAKHLDGVFRKRNVAELFQALFGFPKRTVRAGIGCQIPKSDGVTTIETKRIIGRMCVGLADNATAVETLCSDFTAGGQRLVLSVAEVLPFASAGALPEFFFFLKGRSVLER